MSELAMPTTFEGVRTSPNLTLSLNRALDHARELRHREVNIEHLLLALTDDLDATGSLEACGVDIARLKTDIAIYASKNAGADANLPAVEPVLSAALRSLLDQSVEASREAKRQDINSFIVLAAIVGQEKSEAATILQAHGFTFMEAIEALKPRLARADDTGEARGNDTKGQGATGLRPPARSPAAPVPAAQPSQPSAASPSAANMEEALAQSADALPPLPSARPSRLVTAQRAPAQQPIAAAPQQAPSPAASMPSAPSAADTAPMPAGPSPSPGRGMPPSIDDMMASVRDKMSPQRSPAQRPAAPVPVTVPAPFATAPAGPAADSPGQNPATRRPPDAAQRPGLPQPALPQPALPQPALPQPSLPQAALPPVSTPRTPVQYPGGPPAAPRRPASEAFDLGAPLPEDRIARQPGPAATAGPAARRREPSLAAPSPAFPPIVPMPGPSMPGSPMSGPPIPSPAMPGSPMPSPAMSGPPMSGSGAQPALGAPQPAQAAPQSRAPQTREPQARLPQARDHQAREQMPVPAPQHPPQQQPPRPAAGGHRPGLEAVDPGQLAEAIPRRMRLMMLEKVEVRIARKSLEGLAVGLEGRGTPSRHAIVITSAMSVRLKAPDGGFAIDSISPDTQWIENRLGLVGSDEFASWRWTVRPLRTGRARLQLVVSARTAGADGSTAETALPDQIIEIKVRTNWGLTAKRWAGWITAAVAGGVLAKFGEAGYEVLRKLAGL